MKNLTLLYTVESKRIFFSLYGNFNHLFKFQQMELVMKSQGMGTGLDNEIEQLTLTQQPAPFQAAKFQPDLTQTNVFVNHANIMDEFMDDSSPVNADPMLSSEPVSPSNLDDSSDMLWMRMLSSVWVFSCLWTLQICAHELSTVMLVI